MIPALISLAGAPWAVLPPGIHTATLGEIEAAFATNRRRRDLFGGLVSASSSLRIAGCGRLYLDGSYVTAKPLPEDYDACWDPTGIDRVKLDPVFTNFANKREAQKAKYGGEFFPSTMQNVPKQAFLDFFQIEKFTGGSKGILLIPLSPDPALVGRQTS
jgi:Family of unknown function (DUF6932)